MPAAAIAHLDRALTAWGGSSKSEIYAGAGHGWTMSDHPAYNREQAGRAFDTLTPLLAETFPSA
jgi:carboxymethylenebutenolidase